MTQEELVRRAVELCDTIKILKTAYEDLDAVTLELIDQGFTGAVVDGKEVELVDNFANYNTVFRTHGIKRFEIKVTE